MQGAKTRVALCCRKEDNFFHGPSEIKDVEKSECARKKIYVIDK